MIRINDYPQLKLVCWNRHDEFISEDDALYTYEVNWRFIDKEHLINKEKTLINLLVKQYGNGVLNV